MPKRPPRCMLGPPRCGGAHAGGKPSTCRVPNCCRFIHTLQNVGRSCSEGPGARKMLRRLLQHAGGLSGAVRQQAQAVSTMRHSERAGSPAAAARLTISRPLLPVGL